ncbi:MAG: tRNA 2-thiouridine(34) synthase MnmA [Candidatus Eisenbacteria bacterium]|nr:tRNA 2-thiouridine(34) synthase MnmA [Candidatus Eisenbacteria bacterium]
MDRESLRTVGSRPARQLRVLVAMSGGVDSAVAAHLLRRAGHEVAGATMKLFCYGKEDGPPRPCCDMEAVREARRSAAILGIPHTVVDMEEAFRSQVVEDFVSEYARGRTPNPCVRCNTHVKFGPLLEKAQRMGFDAIATGHYVRCEPVDDGASEQASFALRRARDRAKDQSYVLWELPRERLSRCLFPLGGARKAAVRRLARRLGLPAWDRPESLDICFVPSGEHAAFLRERLPAEHPMLRPGTIRTVEGRPLGQHDGLIGYTLGQRRGVGVPGAERLYVARIEPSSATLYLGRKQEVRSAGLRASGRNLLAPASLLEGPGVTAQIRYRHPGSACMVRLLEADRCEVRFVTPEEAVTPGQSVVFFLGDRMLGGARIDETIPFEG